MKGETCGLLDFKKRYSGSHIDTAHVLSKNKWRSTSISVPISPFPSSLFSPFVSSKLSLTLILVIPQLIHYSRQRLSRYDLAFLPGSRIFVSPGQHEFGPPPFGCNEYIGVCDCRNKCQLFAAFLCVRPYHEMVAARAYR